MMEMVTYYDGRNVEDLTREEAIQLIKTLCAEMQQKDGQLSKSRKTTVEAYKRIAQLMGNRTEAYCDGLMEKPQNYGKLGA